MKKCSVEGCYKHSAAKGYCDTHYRRYKKYGFIFKSCHELPILDRFYLKTKLDSKTGCIEWIGSINAWGYGCFSYKCKSHLAHRFIYQSINEVDISGMLICHHCDNPKCVNINHLFIGTNQDNVNDMMKKGRWIPLKSHEAYFSKLNYEDIDKIRSEIKNGKSNRSLALKFNVSDSTISSIKLNRTWKNIQQHEVNYG